MHSKETERERIIKYLLHAPATIHHVFFEHRHPSRSPEFHKEMIDDYYSNEPRVLHLVFRGGAKSTIAEEAICLMAEAKLIRNCVLTGVSESRAKERLQAIKFELETNEGLLDVFGDQVGDTWSETKIVLKNGVCIQALGRDQSMRGTKHLDARPDYLLMDDIEDKTSCATPEARQKLMSHYTSVMVPSLTPPGTHRIRMTATPLDFDAMAVKFAKSPAWRHRKYPVKYIDVEVSAQYKEKVWASAWPERFTLDEIDKLEIEFKQAGQATDFAREYMLEVMAEEDMQFKPEYVQIKPMRRSYHATYAVYDPARTTNEATSSRTGKVVFSWINNRLIFWETGGYFWKPDELISDIFRTDEIYNPIAIGVEQDGLHEFIMQPLRAQQIDRGRPIPIRALKAPKGKDGFIRGLQPFFKAGEVIFVQDLLQHMSIDDARAAHATIIEELGTFPTGRKDTLNAAAYALVMRPGLPIFDNFNQDHIHPTTHRPFQPTYMAVNCTNTHTTLVVTQVYNGQLHILHDWVVDGDAGTVLGDLARQAALIMPALPSQAAILSDLTKSRALLQQAKCFAPPAHFNKYDTIGLRSAAIQIPLMLFEGGDIARGREEIRKLLATSAHGQPCVRISPQATWTLRAFSGGYCRELEKDGRPGEEPADNVYNTLISGLCSMVANTIHNSSVDNERNYGQTADGQRYLTSRPMRKG